jgi:protein-disulfide isomerase
MIVSREVSAMRTKLDWLVRATRFRSLGSLLLILTAVSIGAPVSGLAQSDQQPSALSADVQRMKKSYGMIMKELRQIRQEMAEIKRLLEETAEAGQPAEAVAQSQPEEPAAEEVEEQAAAAQPSETETAAKPNIVELLDLSVADAPFLGKEDAPVAVVEFGDYECPYCRRHFNKTLPLLLEDYVDDGKVRYIVREFPIEVLHENAFKASEAALCARDQGKYWEMHDELFRNQNDLKRADLTTHAETIGLDTAAFDDCLDGEKYVEQIKLDQRQGAEVGVRGTPYFFLGFTDPSDPTKIKVTRILKGAYPYEAFQETIELLLSHRKDES